MSIEAAVNKNHTDIAHGYSISFDTIRRGWYRFLERCEDYWDLFTIWLHRIEPTIPLREFMEEVDKMNKADVRSHR